MMRLLSPHFPLALGLLVVTSTARAEDAIPLLAAKCLECHSGGKPKGGLDLSDREKAIKGGETGPALVPGKPEDSLIWEHVSAGEMPPKKKGVLNNDEKNAIREWIAGGAGYPDGGRIDALAYTTDSRGGYDWWSLQPVIRPEVPGNKEDQWSRGEIDRFILAKLRENGFEPSPEAEARTQVRRLFFDLTGLPPSPEQVDAFVADPSEAAYGKLVDDLLGSPHYGERWGRHWLDVARFGESDGFERNNVRENQWHYRDWVINAINADMPYDQFVRLQIAGDLLVPGKDGLVAAAFLTAGVYNTVVGGSEFMKKTARQDELEEIAGTVGQTFVGLTVNCARCHDHKFDPISQKEYYQFVSALSGVRHGDKEYRDSANERRAEELKVKVGAVEKEIGDFDAPVIQRVLANRKEGGTEKPKPPPFLYSWAFDSGYSDTTGKLAGKAIGSPKLVGGAVVLDDAESYVETEPLPVSLRAKTIEALVQLSDLDQRGGGVISVQSKGGETFDAIVFGEREPMRWMAGSNGLVRTLKFGGLQEEDAVKRPVHITIVYHEDGKIERYRDGQLYGETYQTGVQDYPSGGTVVRFGVRHIPAGSNKHLRGKIFHAKLYDRALSPDEVAFAAGAENRFVSEEELLAALPAEARAEREALIEERDTLRSELARVDTSAKGKVYTVVANSAPGVTRFLLRGNAMDEGEAVAPGAIKAVQGVTADLGLPENAPDADRRKKLADWVATEKNPLLARVIVNRLWHYHFGAGIVETPNDFGYNGGRPSHPQLLDWLAAEIVKRDWSMKEMHRLMVTSSAYRQASRPRPVAMAKDAGNRLLWRRSPTRLDAESLRDAMLVVSGKLNEKRFGPGFRDVTVKYHEGTTYYTPIDEENDEFHRRTVYRFSPRGGRSAILDTFDCPDPANAAPRRTVTTTPLQALALLNNDFALRIGDHFASRVSEKGKGHGAGVESAYRLAFGRSPDAEESKLASELVKEHGFPALARVLFNSNEFVVIE
jgi:hypothetical protein